MLYNGIMIKTRGLKFLLGAVTALVLLAGIGPVHSVLMTKSMPGMDTGIQSTYCQSSCISGQQIAPERLQSEKEDEDEPQPAKPYYLAFISVGWSMTITVAAVYLFKYLRWRPPDIYKLNACYRF